MRFLDQLNNYIELNHLSQEARDWLISKVDTDNPFSETNRELHSSIFSGGAGANEIFDQLVLQGDSEDYNDLSGSLTGSLSNYIESHDGHFPE